MMGAGGFELFTIIGTQPGATCQFRIAYARPWEFEGFEDTNGDAEFIEFKLTVLQFNECNPDYDQDCLGDFNKMEAISGAATLVASFATAVALTLF